MGKLTVAALVGTFLAAAGAAYLPAPYWQRALFTALTAAAVASLCGLGWSARDRAPEGWPDRLWVLAPALAGLGLAAASFALGVGPGRIAPSPFTIDLPGWAVAASGLGGALGAAFFGVGALASRRAAVAASGALVAGLGLLTVQPALASLGHPRVGPVGLAVAAAAVLALRRLRAG